MTPKQSGYLYILLKKKEASKKEWDRFYKGQKEMSKEEAKEWIGELKKEK